jgi:endonuclease/exonuclease/phosphatase family metal-dependent hydrolase
MRAVYAPVGLHPADPPEEGAVMTGIALFSREAPLSIREIYYKGDRTQAETAPAHRTATEAPLLCADMDCDGTTYRVLSTHFTWTPDGSASDEQRVDMRKLLNTLSAEGEFVLCGDFNAPRGGEIFAELASRYTDNIPPQYATSIDVTLHKRGRERPNELSDKMVDGLFTTPGYRARDVELHFGISDHAAVTALIERV